MTRKDYLKIKKRRDKRRQILNSPYFRKALGGVWYLVLDSTDAFSKFKSHWTTKKPGDINKILAVDAFPNRLTSIRSLKQRRKWNPTKLALSDKASRHFYFSKKALRSDFVANEQ